MPRRGSQPARADADRKPAPAADCATEGTPELELRAALARLTAERDKLRSELTDAQRRIGALERLADSDALTPVANRRAFVRELTRTIAYNRRYGGFASVVYFDVNNMKQINDAYGHAAGDEALRHIATVLSDNVRASDVVARLGGDEFGVILARTDAAQAHGKAAALAEAIAGRPLRWGTTAVAVSAAFGVYAFGGDDDAAHAIAAADHAMYAQKRAAAPHG